MESSPNPNPGYGGPTNRFITTDRVRIFMQDTCAKDNFLLDAREFTDPQIMFAFQMVVANYNTTDPMCDFKKLADFPYYYEAFIGITAQLLRTKALNMVRNRLGGTGQIVDDKQQAEVYLGIAGNLQKEFEQRTRRIKNDINVNGPGAHRHLGGMLESIYGWN